MEKLFQESIDNLGAFYHFTDEELKLLESVDKAADELALPEFNHYLKREFNTEALGIAKKYGLFKIPIKKEFGGLEASPIVSTLAKQRLSQMGLGFGSLINVQVFLCSLSLQRWGTEAQRNAYLKPAMEGDKILAFGLTEPDAGSDPQSMKTTFEDAGSDYVINGSKYLITNGGIANAMLLFAKSKADGKITSFIIDTKSPGFSVSMHLSEKIGLFTSDTAMLEFKDMHIPKDSIVGELGKGMHVAYSALLNGRMGIASSCVGIIQGCLNAVTSRAKERVQHGKPIGKHQLIQKHIAEIRQNLEMAAWPTYFAAFREAEYIKDMNNGELVADMDLRSSLAKKIASRLAFESADRAVQVFGGFGYSLLSPVGQLFCDSRVARIYEGSDEIQELKIAEHVLGEEFRAFS